MNKIRSFDQNYISHCLLHLWNLIASRRRRRFSLRDATPETTTVKSVPHLFLQRNHFVVVVVFFFLLRQIHHQFIQLSVVSALQRMNSELRAPDFAQLLLAIRNLLHRYPPPPPPPHTTESAAADSARGLVDGEYDETHHAARGAAAQGGAARGRTAAKLRRRGSSAAQQRRRYASSETRLFPAEGRFGRARRIHIRESMDFFVFSAQMYFTNSKSKIDFFFPRRSGNESQIPLTEEMGERQKTQERRIYRKETKLGDRSSHSGKTIFSLRI